MATLLLQRALQRFNVTRITHLTQFRACTLVAPHNHFTKTQPASIARLYSTDTLKAPWAELPAEEREAVMLKKLQSQLGATDVNIIDRSGGCGTMYQIELTSAKFKGKGLIQQHRMVNEVLAEEIKHMHGLTLRTLAE